MGTRGAIGFYRNGQTKATYNHWDSCPFGLGVSFLGQILAFDLEQIAGAMDRIELVSEQSTPSPEAIERYTPFADTAVGGQRIDDWYCLLRNVQGEITPFIDGTVDHMIDSTDFLRDSLFCEWAYIVNLDTGEVECHRGFNTNPEASGRYVAVESIDPSAPGDTYYGVRLLTSIPFLTLKAKVDELLVAGCEAEDARKIVAEAVASTWEQLDDNERAAAGED